MRRPCWTHWVAALGLWAAAIPTALAEAEDPPAPTTTQRAIARQWADRWWARTFGASPVGVPPAAATRATAEAAVDQPPLWRRLMERHQIQASLNLDAVLGLWDARRLDEADLRNLLLREIELSIGGHLTPTIRADVFYSIEREEDNFHGTFEEAFISFLALPLGFQARVGRVKAAFGQANQYHTHARPWIDLPAPLVNLFGEEGISGTGLSISRLVPNPWDVYSEVVYQALEVRPGQTLGYEEARGTMQLVHWKNVFDVSEASTLQIGLTAAQITQEGGGKATAQGLDVTYRWRPLEEGLYRSLTWQSELYALQNRIERGEREGLWGAYSSVEYQFARRWSAGFRLDYSQVPEQRADQWAYAPFLTFRQSERLLYRLQFTHTENHPEFGGRSANEVRLEFNWSLGSHRPHAY